MKKTASVILGLTMLAVPLWAQRYQGGSHSGGAPGLGLGCLGNPVGCFGNFDGFQIQAGQGQNFARAKEAIIRYLELTPEQVVAWEELLANLRDQLEPVRSQLAEVQRQLAELLQQEHPDPAAVGALVIQGKALRDELNRLISEYEQAFEALLTPEQAAKLVLARRAGHLFPVIGALRLFHLL